MKNFIISGHNTDVKQCDMTEIKCVFYVNYCDKITSVLNDLFK